MATPSLVAQHDHRVAARTLIVRRRQPASHHRIDANNVKEISRHESHRHHAAIDAHIELGNSGVHVGEDVGLRSHRIEHGARQRCLIAVGHWRSLQLVHLTDVGHLVDAKEQRIENGEQHRHHAKSDGHGHDDRECRQRRLGEGAQRVLDVADGVIDDRGAAFVAALIGGKRCGSEPCLRAHACLGGSHALVDQLGRLALDVEGELFVEFLLDAVWPEQRARPQLQVAEGHASFITRPMAFTIRSHSRASTASWRRPEVVRW